MAKNIIRLYNKSLRVLVIVLSMIIISTFVNVEVKAFTNDDIRELLGRHRLGSEMPIKDIERISKLYLASELNNIAAQMLRLNSSITIDESINLDEIKRSIGSKSKEVYESFVSDRPITEVLKYRTELESYMTQLNDVKKTGIDVDIDYEFNEWADDFKNMKTQIENSDDTFNIGDIGGALKSPVSTGFIITSPFGVRRDPFNKNIIKIHYGLDLAASTGDKILSQWNGKVTKTYKSSIIGNAIEIQHGKGLKTVYGHLSKINVKVGTEVKQYQEIGLAGSTGRSTGPHLHFEIYVDSIVANPIMMYGANGANALIKWMNENPGEVTENINIASIKNMAYGYNKYDYGFYNTIKKDETKQKVTIPPGALVPKLPNGYSQPEPGVLP